MRFPVVSNAAWDVCYLFYKKIACCISLRIQEFGNKPELSSKAFIKITIQQAGDSTLR